jgi:hypothetical protein
MNEIFYLLWDSSSLWRGQEEKVAFMEFGYFAPPAAAAVTAGKRAGTRVTLQQLWDQCTW